MRGRSILSRIVGLHALAVIATAVLLPAALYWFLTYEVQRLQQDAFVSQAQSIAQQLRPDASGQLRLDLPEALKAQYSSAYGRYTYAVLNAERQVLFSSRPDGGVII